MDLHETHMQRAILIASKHLATVRSNPMVGAVLVKNGAIISEGAHEKFGQSHAEVNALRGVPLENSQGATLYVSLEPCCHFGKTPPCTEAVIAAGISKVVYGMADPNPKVSGKGFQRLREAGIEVEGPVLEKECRFLNRRFISLMERGRPWVILKWAESADGFIAPLPRARLLLTGEESNRLVQQYRSEEMAIMVGTTTCLIDNPQLTCRIPGSEQPLRVVVDRQGKLFPELKVFKVGRTTLFAASSTRSEFPINVSCVELINLRHPLPEILDYLGKQQISSLFVEGGVDMHKCFIREDLWDEARIFSTPIVLSQGLSSAQLPNTIGHRQNIGADFLTVMFKGNGD